MTHVKDFGGGAIAINMGDRVGFLADSNGDGRISKGDLLVWSSQKGAEVQQVALGSGEGIVNNGDPHSYNLTFTAEQEEKVIRFANDVYQDSKSDGDVDDESAIASLEQSLGEGSRTYVGDFHGNVRFVGKNSLVDYNVVAEASKAGQKNVLKYTDDIDVHFRDANGAQRVVTVNNIMKGVGSAGQGDDQMMVSETTNGGFRAVANGDELAALVESDGARLRVAGSTAEFTAGTSGRPGLFAKPESFMVGNDGQIAWENSSISQNSQDEFKVELLRGSSWREFVLDLGYRDNEDERRARARAQAATPETL